MFFSFFPPLFLYTFPLCISGISLPLSLNCSICYPSAPLLIHIYHSSPLIWITTMSWDGMMSRVSVATADPWLSIFPLPGFRLDHACAAYMARSDWRSALPLADTNCWVLLSAGWCARSVAIRVTLTTWISSHSLINALCIFAAFSSVIVSLFDIFWQDYEIIWCGWCHHFFPMFWLVFYAHIFCFATVALYHMPDKGVLHGSEMLHWSLWCDLSAIKTFGRKLKTPGVLANMYNNLVFLVSSW